MATGAATFGCPRCGGPLSCLVCNPPTPIAPETLDQPNLLLGEGGAEAHFLEHLIRERALSPFQVMQPARGKADFKAKLDAYRLSSSLPNIANIVLLTDSNGNPDAAFRAVQRQIRDSGGYGAPNDPWVQGPKSPGFPQVSVLLVPSSHEQGSLETLYLKAMEEPYRAEIAAVDAFLGRLVQEQLPPGKMAKARFACLVAVTSREDPSCAASKIWNSRMKLRALLNDETFTPIVDFLRAIAT
jgi:hypothetical protein